VERLQRRTSRVGYGQPERVVTLMANNDHIFMLA